MSQLLPNLSPDILRLRNEGYEVEVKGAFLVIHHVPYVNSHGNILFGSLVSGLRLAGDHVAPYSAAQDTHVIHFIGEYPCHKDGAPIRQLHHQSQTITLTEGLIANHSFSNKPDTGYRDYHHKMTRYAEILAIEAQAIDESVTARTFKVIESKPTESVFNYLDTNSSRAEIESISAKLGGQKVGIVGLGGTGSYVLDLVAKTPVEEIHLFDGDKLSQHNAFRSPGAPSVAQLREQPFKVAYFTEIYSKMRRGIVAHAEFMTKLNVSLLGNIDFIFLCVDDGQAKKVVVTYLEAKGVPFIDVGMGVNICEKQLIGTLRATLSTAQHRDHLRGLVSFSEAEEDAYASNIQIAELNMLNATMAVIRWKKLYGFYQDMNGELNSTYTVNVNMLLAET